MLTIERDSPLPLYHQLKKLLASKIDGGEWRPGDLIPGEQELQSTYALSRTTVRQALRELELDGLLTRYRGKGTFVAKPKWVHDPEDGRGLGSRDFGAEPPSAWRVLSYGPEPAPDDVASRFGIKAQTRVPCLRRVRLAAEEAIGHHVAYVAPAFAGAIDETAFTGRGSLAYLENHPTFESATIERYLEAIASTAADEELLDVAPQSPLLRITRFVSSRSGAAIECCLSTYRGDRFQYHFRSSTPKRP